MASPTAHASEKSRIDQIVLEFFAKSLHIILESRIPFLCGGEVESVGSSASSSSSGIKSRDRWFNLALGDCTSALENFEPWRKSFSDSMVVDVLFVQPKVVDANMQPTIAATAGHYWSRGGSSSEVGSEGSSSMGEGSVLERWTVQFERRKGNLVSVSLVYKRIVIMLRSLYSWCRQSPAYRLFRLASTSAECCSFSLNYKVLSSPLPLSEDEERDMLMYRFTPVETAYGRMCLSVASRPSTAVTALEVVPPILPQIIPDYVGSPTTDPLKRFPAKPHAIPASGISRVRGVHMVSVPSSIQNSPPCSSLGRRHSWSGGVEQMQPTLQPPSSPSCRSPSPSYPNEINASYPYPPSSFSPSSRRPPQSDYSFSPLSSPVTSTYCQQPHLYRPKDISQPINIESCQSPPFSSSPSMSPPAYYSQERIGGKGIARPGSAPVSIPKTSHSRVSKASTMDLQHSRNLLPPPSPKTRGTEMSNRSSSESPRYSGQLLSHTQRATSFESPLQLRMPCADLNQQERRNEGNGGLCTAGNLFRGRSQPILSRASNKGIPSVDTDDEFIYPFVVDDNELEEKQSRTKESSSSSMQTILQQGSQNAAVGALVRLLKSASPLRQSSCPPALRVGWSPTPMDAHKMEITSGNAMCERRTGELLAALEQKPEMLSKHYTKKAADALKELEGYKKIRDVILSQRHNLTAGPSGGTSTVASDGNR